MHPLAGQGVNLGFGDVMSLASVVEKCLVNGAPLGDRDVKSLIFIKKSKIVSIIRSKLNYGN